MPRLSLLAAASAAFLAVLAPVQAQTNSSAISFDSIETIFSFGDSYSTVGYDPRDGVTDLPLLGGTTSGGLNWVEYLALSSSLTNNSYYDFARSGATVNNSVVVAASDAPPAFLDQEALFEQYFVGDGKEVQWNSETSLFTVFFGINDIGFISLQSKNATELIPQVVGSWQRLVTKLYANGARNFLFVLVPPTWRTPYVRSFGSDMIDTFVANIEDYTMRISAVAAAVPTLLPGSQVAIFDPKPLFHAILDTPAAFGFNKTVAGHSCGLYWNHHEPELDIADCDAPLKDYIWMDDYHPTWSVHKLLAGKISDFLSDPAAQSAALNAATDAALIAAGFTTTPPTTSSVAPASETSSSAPAVETTEAAASVEKRHRHKLYRPHHRVSRELHRMMVRKRREWSGL
ncbi:hypothetical protein JCM10207_005924 [Rhodosporidiobolus poonsookiae]